MDPHAAVNALSPPHTPLNSTTSVPVSPRSNAPPRHTPPQNDDSDKNEGAHGRSSEGITALSYKLLVKVQQVFGEESKEWANVNHALYAFNRGETSKKEAHRIMTQVLGDSFDLTQDLFNILNHNDADWGPDDWSQPINPPAYPQAINPTISPSFLQPQHEPQFPRLPSVFGALNPGQHMTRPQPWINPTVLQSPSTQYVAAYHSVQGSPGHDASSYEGYPRYDGHQGQLSPYAQGTHMNWNPNPFVPNGLSSPMPLMPNTIPHLPSSQQSIGHRKFHPDLNRNPLYASPVLGMNSTLQSYSGLGYGTETNSSAGFPVEQYQHYPHGQSWQEGNTMGGWTNTERLWQYEQDRAMTERQGSHSFSPQEETTPQLVSGQLSSTNASPSVLGTPIAVPLGQPTPEAMAIAKHEHSDTAGDSPQDTNMHELELQTVERSKAGKAKVHRAQSVAVSGSFIHAICGKGFSSRSAVKKHHWGPKSQELSTTRGCWAKHQKPDRAW